MITRWKWAEQTEPDEGLHKSDHPHGMLEYHMGCKVLLDRIESGHDKDCLTMDAYMSACDFLLPGPVIVVCPLIYEIDGSGQGL